jgi:hypothetical protein
LIILISIPRSIIAVEDEEISHLFFFFVLQSSGYDIRCDLQTCFRTQPPGGRAFLETREGIALWKSVVAVGKCKGMSRRHEGSGENGGRRKSTRQREAKINGFVLSAFFQAF